MERVVPIDRGIEDDPGGSTSEIQNGKGRFILGHPLVSGRNSSEEVVSGDSSEDSFILSIHNRHIFVWPQVEFVLLPQPARGRIQDILALLLTQQWP